MIKTPRSRGRMMSEVIAALEASGSRAVMDEDFARDVEEAGGRGFWRGNRLSSVRAGHRPSLNRADARFAA
jgi:hypothetical protein